MAFSTLKPLGSHNLIRNGVFQIEVSSGPLNFRHGESRGAILFASLKHVSRSIVCRNELRDHEERSSANEVKKEIMRCYEIIQRLERGVVYLGSSRMNSDHPYFLQAVELGREVAILLDCTTWTGAGPGLMDAAAKGAMEAGKPVGGFKIRKEAGQWTSSNLHPYLPPETYFTCRFFSARKHGLVDAAVRNRESERTAVIVFPGGIGTLDEVFEMLTLIQLQRLGSEFPVPFVVINYDGFYSKLLGFLEDCEQWGTVSKGEVESLWKVCSNNLETLNYLAEFYGVPHETRPWHIV
ncbi:probable cytokinin riboside 5'-monophosphate phosphoribohydrolase LOGL9 isoform X2 [Amborella trichopoda]|uniref:probable cytokinin riboside 5'-monophosphate phosphoribohydrolase LOGL9 isoform X2 n=1 Tax=Amborella trichopoda TaxID=13333 RepID=UPI0009BE2129|nr:probable cytokinin riboside 5'-monophosphate phosphoribohydrolase LOGL9 isoform X2 [Amborella trichopoda]|eukprot:XP_020530738.1 probable cytokinin riboside 5'-monophosphate phosphoribohydrolase LOGL9 isoform X2 [Amborella trichopoda]